MLRDIDCLAVGDDAFPREVWHNHFAQEGLDSLERIRNLEMLAVCATYSVRQEEEEEEALVPAAAAGSVDFGCVRSAAAAAAAGSVAVD